LENDIGGSGEKEMLTKDQKEKYLKHPANCPYCGSSEVSYEGVTFDSSKVWHEISCSKCNKRWADVYALTDVEEVG
jgi:transcription elongation factor Elf1